MRDAFTQKIHECAMETEDNLVVFVRAAQSFGEFHKDLISSFSTKLEQKLRDKFPASDGWEIHERTLITDPLKGYPNLSIRKNSWQSKLRVGVEASKSGTIITYGVIWESQHDAMRNDVFNEMNQRIRQGLNSQYWPFYFISNRHYFRFSNWYKEDAIISMRQVIKGEQPAEILDFFYNELVAIVEALDKFVKGWS